MADDTKKTLQTQLWNIANTLRGKMGADEFRDYILGFIFYKYLSERVHLFADEILKHDGIRFDQIDESTPEGAEMLAAIKEESVGRLGYFLKPSELFHKVAEKGAQKQDNFILEDLTAILKHIEASTMGHASEEDFEGLFEDLDLGSSKLGKTENQKNELIAKVLAHLDKIDFRLADTEADVLGDAYEYLIGQFASGAGKKAGEFYTPQEVSTILAKIVTTGKTSLKSVYDPTCGSGSHILVKQQTSLSPRLRFSGFAEPWRLKPMKQLLLLIERPFKMADDDEYSLITVRRGNNGVVSRGKYAGRKVLVKTQFKVEAEDFVISKRQIVHQACGIVPGELTGAIVSNEYNVFKPSSECCIRYFDYFCHRPEMRHAFFLSCVGVHLEKMLFKTNDWLKRRFYFPSAEEQRKIADFLTAVDRRISQLSQKKARLEDYKRGVMQQLFTQAIRFKDDRGNDFPDWEENSFYDLLEQVLDFRGRTPLKLGMNWGGGDVKSLSANNVKNGYIDFAAECNLGSQALYERWMGGVNLSKGDIVFTMEAPLGKALQVPDNQKYILSQRVVAFKTKKLISNDFLLQLIWSADFQAQLSKLATGSTAKGINQKSLRNVEVIIPSLPEQTKIANFLTALDRKIEAVAAQIAHTQSWKKGLLQQMFV